MERNHIRFYINDHGRLSLIWYAKRCWVLTGTYNDHKQEVPDDAPAYVVRKQVVGSAYHMRKQFNLQCYAQDEEEAKYIIDRFVYRRHLKTPLVPSSITDQIVAQLSRAPIGWLTTFIEYLKDIWFDEDIDQLTNMVLNKSVTKVII